MLVISIGSAHKYKYNRLKVGIISLFNEVHSAVNACSFDLAFRDAFDRESRVQCQRWNENQTLKNSRAGESAEKPANITWRLTTSVASDTHVR